MLVKAKATLARYPLAGFFALAGAAYVVCVGLLAAVSPMVAAEWANRFSMVSAMVAGLAALACCRAISGPRSRPPRRFTQLFIVVAVVLVTMTALCVEVWLQWRMERGLFAGAGGSPGVYVMPMPSLGSWIHRELGTSVFWLRALVAGLVLAGVVSPFAAVRRLSRELIAWRGPRVWLLAAVALLVPGACAAAASLGGRLAPLAVDGSVPFRYSLSYSIAAFVTALLVNVPLVFAWYGFVNTRLTRRVSPLVAALVIGLAIALPYQLAVCVGYRSWFPVGGWNVLDIVGEVALAVPAVWLVRRARESLIPAAVLLAAVSTSEYVTWTSSNLGILGRARELYPGCIIVAAVLFALAGRMWRRTGAPALLPTLDESNPGSDGYEASVDDVGVASATSAVEP
jgi:uncharacterized protein (DUF486 family)